MFRTYDVTYTLSSARFYLKGVAKKQLPLWKFCFSDIFSQLDSLKTFKFLSLPLIIIGVVWGVWTRIFGL